uniref:Uncharacterized protein n=1 Tax=Arundo donax TaxID=35708 RepID=A0A0A9B9X2_ARUDO
MAAMFPILWDKEIQFLVWVLCFG